MKAMKFRNSFFGGFNKADVMKYIEELQKKQPQTSQMPDDETESKEIIALKKENERLVLALEKANEQIKNLKKQKKESTKTVSNLKDNIKIDPTENTNAISGDISGMIKSTEDIAKDFDNAVKKLNGDLEEFKKYLETSSEYFDEQQNIHSEIDLEDENIKEILSQSYELIEESGLKQLEISKIIDDLKSRYE